MKYFTLKEFERSDTAVKFGIDNTIPQKLIPNVEALVTNVLDPLRERFGKPIIVNSGYRSPALNKKREGAPKSQHMKGEAADIRAADIRDNIKLWKLLTENGLVYDQAIKYISRQTGRLLWIHVSYTASDTNRKAILEYYVGS